MAGGNAIESLKDFFLKATDSFIQDAASKGQKIPIQSLHFAVDANGGEMYGAHYIQYLIVGRGPGKQPPPEAMTKFVRDTPDLLAAMENRFPGITAAQAGYLIGRKIGRFGTDIYQGKKPGVDLLGSMEKHMPQLLKDLGEDAVREVVTELRNAIKI